MGKLNKAFCPEFLSRIDEIVVFHPLTQDHLRSIVRLELSALKERLRGLPQMCHSEPFDTSG